MGNVTNLWDGDPQKSLGLCCDNERISGHKRVYWKARTNACSKNWETEREREGERQHLVELHEEDALDSVLGAATPTASAASGPFVEVCFVFWVLNLCLAFS